MLVTHCSATRLYRSPIARRLNGKPSFQSSLYFIEIWQNWIEKIWWYATSTAKKGRVTHWQRCVDLAHLDSDPPTVIPTSLCRLPLFDEQFFNDYFTLVLT